MEISLKLSDEELKLVLAGIGELPLKLSANVFQKVQKQVLDQVEKKPEEKLAE